MSSSQEIIDGPADEVVAGGSPEMSKSQEEDEARRRAVAIANRSKPSVHVDNVQNSTPSVPQPRKARSNSIDDHKSPPEMTNREEKEKEGEKDLSGKPPVKGATSKIPEGNTFVKIIELQADDSGKLAESKQTKATIHGPKLLNFQGAILGDIRKAAGTQLKPSHKFCYRDGSIASDKMLLVDYLKIISHEQPTSQDASEKNSKNAEIEKKNADTQEASKTSQLSNTIYVMPPPKPTPEAILLSPPFVMKIFEWKIKYGAETQEGRAEGRGSIHSKSFRDADLAAMTLAGLRKRVSEMSAHTRIHRFCTSAGTTVEDESLTVMDYLSQEATREAPSAKETKSTPIINIYYKLNQILNQPHVSLETPNAIKTNVDLTNYERTSQTVGEFKSKPLAYEIDVETLMKGAEASTGKGAAYLTEADWDQVFRNCSLLYGWFVDREKNCIRQAPKQAFQIKSKNLKDSTLNEIPDFVESLNRDSKKEDIDIYANSAPTSNNYTEEPILKAKHRVKPKVPDLQSFANANVFKAATRQSEGLDGAVKLSDLISHAKHFDGNVTTGWTQVEAGDAGVTEETTIKVGDEHKKDILGKETASKAATQEEVESGDGQGNNMSTLPRIQKRELVMPSFQVNDDSRIEVIVSEHEFETSMARNDFSSSSTEGSMSAGYAGFSATVTAGHSRSKSASTKKIENTYQKTIIAKFLFPRATVHLHPNDLEPTPELAELIEKIRTSNNINYLRRLHQDYGHIFCKTVTLGGRLLSSKIIEGTEKGTEQEQKEQFKTSIGMQVQTPFGASASAKRESERGSSTASRENEKNKNEKHVFEAVGGNTILAAEPAAWSSSVADEKYWRVINREGLYSLAAFISAIPGLERVQSYFIRAVPALTKYIELPPSKEIKARFKLVSPRSHLSLGDKALYYLGHEFGRTSVMPSLQSLKKMEHLSGNSYYQVDYDRKVPLFSPPTTRAPVLQGYKYNLVGDQLFGSLYTKDFLATAWSIVAPFDQALQNGTRIILRTVPFVDQAPTTDSKKEETAVSLVIYRNQQGQFLPALSDIDEFQYWRIWRKGESSYSREYIKEGDEVRFSWSFNDQTTGFRDYTDDLFGRRRNQCPSDLSQTTLWFKLPFPRFEPLNDRHKSPSNSMIMAPIPSTETMQMDVRCLPAESQATGSFKYWIHDVTFRIDMIANDGRGDTDDYMMKDIQQDAAKDALNFRAVEKWYGIDVTSLGDKAFFL